MINPVFRFGVSGRRREARGFRCEKSIGLEQSVLGTGLSCLIICGSVVPSLAHLCPLGNFGGKLWLGGRFAVPVNFLLDFSMDFSL